MLFFTHLIIIVTLFLLTKKIQFRSSRTGKDIILLKCLGGSKKDGCGRVLTRDKYVDHDNEPYCSACYSKLFRPKGFGFGNTLSTDYGPDAAVSNDGHVEGISTSPALQKSQPEVSGSQALSTSSTSVPSGN